VCDQRATIVGRCEQHLASPSSSPGVINNRPTAVVDYIALGDGGRAVAMSRVWDKGPDGSTPIFRDTRIFLKYSRVKAVPGTQNTSSIRSGVLTPFPVCDRRTDRHTAYTR